MIKKNIYVVLFVGMCLPIVAQDKKEPTTISIADKDKYELQQLRISDAYHTYQLQAQLTAQAQQAQNDAQEKLNKIIADTLKSLGIKSNPAEWMYNPATFTFAKTASPAQQVAPTTPAENKK